MPLLIVSILGFVDLAMGVLQTSQVTSAAADGARAGIVSWSGADQVRSSDRVRIESAVHARLVGQRVDSITVHCVDPGDTVVSCHAADPAKDRLSVVVQWTFRPISPVGSLIPTRTLTGRATMGLVAQPERVIPTSSTTIPTTTTTMPSVTTSTLSPSSTTSTSTASATTTTTAPQTTTTTAPEVCALVSFTSDPASVRVKRNGSLWTGFAVTAVTNGNPTCTALSMRLDTGVQNVTISFSKLSATTWSATVGKGTFDWTEGQKVVAAYSGATPIGSGVLVVTL